MKKRILLFGMIAVIAIGMCGCGKNKSTEAIDTGNSVEESESADNGNKMEKYIKGMTQEEKNDFLHYWRGSQTYCGIIEYELKEMGNTNSYEFDPTDKTQIPEELKDIDFDQIKRDDTKNLHSDFKIKIDGKKVELSYDGMDIYPTEYSFSDIQKMIEA
ncbi:MAG: hypothetical protein J5590_08945 [Clostridia bacterium]|nr:hypothetical protein [Clostridia bacterium]